MIFRAICLGAALILATPAISMTVCNGDHCTISENGKERQMTDKEKDRHFRQNNLSSMANIRCKYSDDEAKCDALAKQLRSIFVW